MHRAAAATLLMLSAAVGAAAPTPPPIPTPKSSFHVETAASNTCGLPEGMGASLQSHKFTKVVCPFGILVAGTEDYPDNYMLLVANTVAELLDLNKDGVADDPAVVQKLTYRGGKAVWLAGATTARAENQCDKVKPQKICFGLQTWNAEKNDPEILVRQIETEETFHMLQQFGFGVVHPEAVGAADFTTSVACREMARLECVKPGWWHEENKCPKPAPREPGNPAKPPLRGTCSEPDCDCVEFYHQAALYAAGQATGWNSPYMPTTQSKMRAMLSDEFKAMLANPKYHQIQKPLTYAYTANATMPSF